MFYEIKNAIVCLLLMTIITGLIYPAIVTAISAAAFPSERNGSLVEGGSGSSLIGQSFDDPKYFWSRPSGASYNAGASSGTNFGPTNPALIDQVKTRIAALKAADPGNDRPIPVDLVTASGSGLDPHISPAAAEYQAARVARVREIDLQKVRELVTQATSQPTLGILGEARVNVLKLNLLLDGNMIGAANQHASAVGWRARGFLPGSN